MIKYADIPILMYHEISEQKEGAEQNPWCVSPENFARQMRWLKENGYKTISLTELQKGIEKNKETDQKSVVLTFDDGREGVYTHVFPLIQELGFTATVYIVPSWVEGGMEGQVPEEERYSAFMNWEEIQELARAGWEIGSHSFSHQDFSEKNLSKEKMTWELQHAEEIIRERTGQKVQHFAYPHGRYNEESVLEIQQRYKTAVTTEKGFARPSGKYARQGILHSTTLENFLRLLRKPTLSVCMIVKNEEQFLEKCLLSVKPIADEIILVDTGSTDNTKKIAQQFSAKIFDFSWNDDFAAARNESLKPATGDWILVLDADEVLNPDDYNLFYDALNTWENAGYYLLTRNYHNDSTIMGWVPTRVGETFFPSFSQSFASQPFTGWYPSIKIRLFQRHPAVRFQGVVHEQVDEKALQLRGAVTTLPAPVHHYGALKSGREDKINQYMALAKKKILVSPTDAKAYYELGRQHLALGQWWLAENAFQQALAIEQRLEPLYHLALAQQKQGKYAQAIENYQRVLSQQQGYADAHFGLGFCFFQLKGWTMAREHFQKTIVCSPLFVEAYVNLAAVLEQQNLLVEANVVLQKALELAPQHARAHYNLGVVLERKGFIPKAIEAYERALALKYPKAGLAERIPAMRGAWERAESSEERNPIAG